MQNNQSDFTRILQNVVLYIKYKIIDNAYPYLVYSNILRNVSWANE